MNDFTGLELKYNNLDKYIRRKAILNSIDWVLPLLKGDLLDIGCGKMPYKKHILENSNIVKYIGLDLDDALIYDQSVMPDYVWDGLKMPFANETFSNALGTEVLEHCPDTGLILSEVYRVLKDDGIFFFTIPFIWNLHEVPHDEYRFTPFSLKRHLENAGFINIELYSSGGWDAYLAQALGTWVIRSGISSRKKKIIRIFIKPLMQILLKLDNKKMVIHTDGQMITDIYGIARK